MYENWTDDEITEHLGAMSEDDRDRHIASLDTGEADRCLQILGLTWGDIGGIEFTFDDAPPEQGPLPEGQITITGNGLADGRYVFGVDGETAYVYREWSEIGASSPIGQFDAEGLPDGAIGWCDSVATEWTQVVMVDPGQTAGILANSAQAEVTSSLESAVYEFERSLAALVAEPGTDFLFLATDRWVVPATITGRAFDVLAPVALTATLGFTRNRTKPNVFTISEVRAREVPAGTDTALTGFGNDGALSLTEQTIRSFCLSASYPYRDGERIVIEIV